MSKDEITTQTLKEGVAKTSTIKLGKTPETRITFEALIHEKGVSGKIIKYKKDRKSDWDNLQKSDFSSHALDVMEKVEIPVSTDELLKLITEIQLRYRIAEGGVKSGIHSYIPVEKDSFVLIDNENIKQILESVLIKGYSDDFWQLLSASEPDLANRLSAGQLQLQREKIVKDLERRLLLRFSETNGNDSWQRWIHANNWLFGINYQKPIEKEKINISGVMPDFLFPTVDGFIDILEIKLPEDEVISSDGSHQGAWKWTAASNTAIGQVVNYLSEIDRMSSEIENNIRRKYELEVSCLKPRAHILIGNSQDWKMEKKEGLRKLNHSLHGIEVITYFDLIQRGKSFSKSPVAGVRTDIDNLLS
ncbi:MAG: Shedu anti-phage system protein SduA domain-containing protein [bacterium]